MSKTPNKYITGINFADRTLFALSDANKVVSLCSFATVVLGLLR